MFRKRWGERRAVGEMLRRGLERELVAEVMEETQPDPTVQLAEIIEKKYTPLPQDEKGRRRMLNALARMGYGWSDIRSALAQAEESMEGWNESDE